MTLTPNELLAMVNSLNERPMPNEVELDEVDMRCDDNNSDCCCQAQILGSEIACPYWQIYGLSKFCDHVPTGRSVFTARNMVGTINFYVPTTFGDENESPEQRENN